MLIDILVLSSLYVLLGIGYVIVYRASRVLNLAQGEIFMIAGYLTFTIASTLHLPALSVLPIALIGGAVFGIVVYLLLIAPLAGHSLFAAVLVTLALGMVVRAAALAGWSGQIVFPGRSLGLENDPLNLFGLVTMSRMELYIFISAVAVTLLLLAFFRYSPLGVRMRAASEDPRLAAHRGINIHALFALSWGMATAVSMYAGALYSLNQQVNAGLTDLAIRGLVVALVGGMDSIGGLLPAALLVAGLEILTAVYISPQAAEAAPFVLLILVLLFRPWGIFGTKEVIDRI